MDWLLNIIFLAYAIFFAMIGYGIYLLVKGEKKNLGLTLIILGVVFFTLGIVVAVGAVITTCGGGKLN